MVSRGIPPTSAPPSPPTAPARGRFSSQSRRGGAEQQQRRGRLGQLQPGRLEQLAGCLWPDSFAHRGRRSAVNFLINQFTTYNQRTPAVAALTNGGFVVAWVSEQERSVAPVLRDGFGFCHAPIRSDFQAWTFMRGFTTATALRPGRRISREHGFQSLREPGRGRRVGRQVSW